MWPTAVAPLASRQGFTSAAVGATAAAAWYKTTLMEEASSTDDTADTVNDLGPIEINLMDKISNKIYLNPSRVRSSNLKKRNSDTAPPSVVVSERPVGVPSSLRILAIDLPEMREQAFSRGECRVAFNAVYPDGIAPPKTVVKQEDENGDKRELVVEQKAWVRSLVKCVQSDLPDKVGVEMMEASFSHLNPKNLVCYMIYACGLDSMDNSNQSFCFSSLNNSAKQGNLEDTITTLGNTLTARSKTKAELWERRKSRRMMN